jgi:hypothetical protein
MSLVGSAFIAATGRTMQAPSVLQAMLVALSLAILFLKIEMKCNAGEYCGSL